MTKKSGNIPGLGNYAGAAGQIITSEIQENLFISGLSFSWEDWLSYDADEEKLFIFYTLLCVPACCVQLIFNPLVFAANAGPIKIDIYTEVSYVNGTSQLLQQSNRRETSDNTSDAILRVGERTNMEFTGTKFSGDLIPSNGAAAPNAAGNTNPAGLPFEIDITKIKAVGLTNTDGNGVLVSHKFNWFEVPAGF